VNLSFCVPWNSTKSYSNDLVVRKDLGLHSPPPTDTPSLLPQYLRADERDIEARLEEQAQLQLAAAAARAQAEARDRNLNEKQTSKLIKAYQKQVNCFLDEMEHLFALLTTQPAGLRSQLTLANVNRFFL